MKRNSFLPSYYAIVLISCISLCLNFSNARSQVINSEVGVWITTADRASLLKRSEPLQFKEQAATGALIEIDTSVTYQTMDGFGFALTGGSAQLINQKLNAIERTRLLQELFLTGPNEIGISYLRISIGASDLDGHVFSYDDLPEGETDVSLLKFSLQEDQKNLIPVLKQILTLNPHIKIMASPWSPPIWMKSNRLAKGGSLNPEYYHTYAHYFVKYILGMAREGIAIDALTIQNEPENPNNTPSLVMTATEQNAFIKNQLGPAFKAAGITTKIILYDHNCDHPEYPISILNDAVTRSFVDGSAFHLYAGDITALSTVKTAHPDKNIYFTEQWTSADGDFGNDLLWHTKNLIIGATRHWSKVVLEWNLASDQNFNPHTTDGGCERCMGALTIDKTIKRNASYYVIAHASKFVVPGSIRIQSNQIDNLNNVAFISPLGKKIVIVVNESKSKKVFAIRYKNTIANTSLPAGAVGTFSWK